MEQVDINYNSKVELNSIIQGTEGHFKERKLHG